MSSETITKNDLKAILDEVLPSISFLDVFYPIGSYYETSDTSFDPNVAWGGTWVQETSGQVHVSAGGSYSVSGALSNTSDGGASAVALNDVKYLPSHTHGEKALSGYIQLRRYGSAANTGNAHTTVSGIVSASYPTGQSSANGFSGNTVASTTHTRLAIDATHTHNSVGSGTAHENMQPYIVVNRWHRTA